MLELELDPGTLDADHGRDRGRGHGLARHERDADADLSRLQPDHRRGQPERRRRRLATERSTPPRRERGSLKTLSVSFTSDESGTITFAVSAIDAENCIVGRGLAMQVIRKGGVAEVIVDMTPANDCTTDGGTPDGRRRRTA